MMHTVVMHIITPYSFLGSCICTIFALQWWQQATYPQWLWIALLIMFIGGCVGCIHGATKRISILFVAGILGTTFAFVTVQHHVKNITNQTIVKYANQAVHITGIVRGQPDDKQTFVRYVVDVENITHSGAVHSSQGFVLVTDRAMIRVADPGDTITAQGKLMLPADDEDFSYKAYLAMDEITAIMNARFITIDSSDDHAIARMLWRIRRICEEQISMIFPEPGASLLAGLLTGSRRGLPQNIADQFRITGISHIIAISGSNITIILSVMGGALFFLPLRWRLIPNAIGITLFTILVGAEASVVRASIMGILGLVALHAGRLTHTRLMILWTAFFMLLWNPAQLWTDMGFHLSFLAVIGLAECQPLLEPLLKRVPKTAGLRDVLMATLAAQITTTPWSASQFGQISLSAPLTNIIVAPLVPIAMLCGFLGTIVGWIVPSLGRIIGIPATVALQLILDTASVLSQIPYSSVTIPEWSRSIILCAYAVPIVIIIRMKFKPHKKRVVITEQPRRA